VKELFATAFEVDGSWLIKAASRRQKWIDQAQSLNLDVAAPNGRKLDELYQLAWTLGCKTTYYLRSASASHVEKSTLKGTDGKLNAVSPAQLPTTRSTTVARSTAALPDAVSDPIRDPVVDGAACSIDNPDCEACQ
jgi:ribonucleoside-diphosphate reductase alpha chain